MFALNFLFKKQISYLKVALIAVILIFAVNTRIQEFSDAGKDYSTYMETIQSFLRGENIYQHTIDSYKNVKDIGGHGYAYFPGFLYLFTFLYGISLKIGISYVILWKIPVLLADIGVAILLYRYLSKYNFFVALFAVLFWCFNPYTYTHGSYSLVDPVPVFFSLLALLYLEKDDVLSGVFFTLSVIFKPFALIFLPLFLIKAKKWYEFILACGIIFGIISLPFILSLNGILTYLGGTILVHSNRVLEGRPFLFYISYFYKVELFQIIPLSFYSRMATFFGWVLILVFYFVFKLKDKFILASLSALNFLLFTPVLNRTYLLWFIPIFIIALFNLSSKYRKNIIYYTPLVIYWVFCYWYLQQWKDGFHVWHP